MKGVSVIGLKNLKRPELVERRAFLGGMWAARDRSFAVNDPATGEHLVDVAMCDLEDADRAVIRASDAFLQWRDLLPTQRGLILRSWAANMRANAEDLAVIMTAEQGKPISESR